MKCPHCFHVSETALLRCRECGETYDRDTLEQFQHAAYLLDWLEAREGVIGPVITQNLRNEVLADRNRLRDILLPAQEPEPEPQPFPSSERSTDPSIHNDPALMAIIARLVGVRALVQEWLDARVITIDNSILLHDLLSGEIKTVVPAGSDLEKLSMPQISREDLQAYALELLDEWAGALLLSETYVELLREHLQDQLGRLAPREMEKPDVSIEPTDAVPVTTMITQEAILEPVKQEVKQVSLPSAPPPAPRAPAVPPKPREPLIQWSKVWEKIVDAAVSGLLLRWLRYLGAFLFVVSLAIVVISFWENIPQWGQVGIIFFIPMAFYGGGWFTRARLKVEQTGGVLMGVGALLLAVDFAAIYQFGGLTFSLSYYWFVTSLICTAVYLFTSWRILRTEFFGYISLAGIGSTLMAATRVTGLSLEWMFAGLALLALPVVEVSHRLRSGDKTWGELALACRRFPQILLPASLGVLLFVPGEYVDIAQFVAFIFATATYGLMGWYFHSAVYAHLTSWGAVLTAGLGMRVANLPWEWFPAVGVVLAPVYEGLHRWVGSRMSGEALPRTAFRTATRWTGIVLLGGGLLAAFLLVLANILLRNVSAATFDAAAFFNAGLAALFLGTAVFSGYANLFRQPWFVLAAAVLGVVPLTLLAGDNLLLANIPQWGDWLAAIWAASALLYMGLMILLRKLPDYGKWLALTAQGLLPVALAGGILSGITTENWSAFPALASLGSVILVYLFSAVLHDSGKFPALSGWLDLLPQNIRKAAFLWPLGGLIPVWIGVAWADSVLVFEWLGVALTGTGLLYTGLGIWLARRDPSYRTPLEDYAFVLAVAGPGIAYIVPYALMTALYLSVLLVVWMAVIYRSTLLVFLGGLLLLWPFQLSLTHSLLTPHGYSLAYVLLAGLGYVPLGIWLKRKAVWTEKPTLEPGMAILVIGYVLSVAAVAGSLLGRIGVYPVDVPWVGVAVPLFAAALYVFSAYYFKQAAFSWAAVITFTFAFWQTLTLLRILPEYQAVAWISLGIGYLVLGKRVARFLLPLNVGAWLVASLGVLLTLPVTANAFVFGLFRLDSPEQLIPPMVAQGLGVGFVILAAVLYRNRWPLFLEPWLAFVPVTLFFIGFGEQMFGQRILSVHFGIIWAVVGLVHVLIAAVGERVGDSAIRRFKGSADQPPSKRSMSMMQGVYLGGYGMGAVAAVWAVSDQLTFLWAFGLWIVMMVGSAFLVHLKLHLAWANVLELIFGTKDSPLKTTLRDGFIWLAVLPFPVWVTVLLWQVGVTNSFGYLGYAGSALAFLGLAVWLRRVESTYAWPLITAGQFFTLFALLQTMGTSVVVFSGQPAATGGRVLFTGFTPEARISLAGYILVQGLAVLYYGLSSWYFQNRKWAARFFSYAASGLVFVPYTIAWMAFRFDGYGIRLVYTWLGLAAGLLGVGYALDWVERRRVSELTIQRVGFGHGPYIVGYLVLAWAFVQSWADQWVNIVAWAGVVLLAGLSQIAVHYGRHVSFLDFMNFFWRKEETLSRRAVHTVFLFIAAYGFPACVAQSLAYNEVQLAWRGLSLALIAPLYIAFGLAARRVREEYSWPLFSAGYLLTAVGGLVSFDDPLLSIYVLSLNAVVYAASAYIFRRAEWLYLFTFLVPIIGLMALDYNLDAPPANWVAGMFMALAFVYFVAGWWFDWKMQGSGRPKGGGAHRKLEISSFALPFYAPGYLLSALALAVSSVDRPLAIIVYLSGVLLYALSAWAFREAIFLYPAVWLAAVPYYLGMTYTRLLPAWYGIGWLPLILAAIGMGRFVFHRQPLLIEKEKDSPISLFSSSPIFTHPAMPFYILAYALSLSMMFIARGDMTALTMAFGAAAVLYLGSAGLFRRAWWMYPGLLAGHLALFTYFAIDPSGFPVRYISLVFVPVTWAMGIIGGVLRRRERRLLVMEIGHWASPFLLFAVLDVVGWGVLSLLGWETGVIVATSHALLLGVVAMMWTSVPLVWSALGFLLLAIGLRMGWIGLELPVFAATVAGIGFCLYLTGRVVETLVARVRSEDGELPGWRRGMVLWSQPLIRLGIGTNSIGAVVLLAFILSHTTQAAVGMAFAGAMYLAVAYRGRYYRLGYLAVAMLEAAFVLLLWQQDIRQPQWYAIPAGLYFAGVGVFERQRGRKTYAVLVEGFGLTVMLVTSFIQSLSLENGFWYFLLLLGEGMLVIGWGAQQRRRIPFLIGLVGSVVNVAGQVVVLFMGGSTLTRWVIFGGVGLLLLLAALFAERWIIPRAQEMRERLENWQ